MAILIESIDGDRYKVVDNYRVKSTDYLNLDFIIPKGFESDLASIPRMFRPFLDRASLGLLSPVLHDYLCSTKGKVINFQGISYQIEWFDVHILFLVFMRLEGVSWHRALIAFLAVLIGVKKWS